MYPDLDEDEAYERLWDELEHVLRLDEADAAAAWDERMAVLSDAADALTERAFDAIELRGPGTELTVGMLPTHRWWAADFTRADGLRHLPNLPTEEVFTTPDPLRTRATSRRRSRSCCATARSCAGCACASRTASRSRSTPTRTPTRSVAARDRRGRARLGELALVDRQGRIGPLGTVFYNTLLDENAASHIALGAGFKFAGRRRRSCRASTRASRTSTS